MNKEEALNFIEDAGKELESNPDQIVHRRDFINLSDLLLRSVRHDLKKAKQRLDEADELTEQEVNDIKKTIAEYENYLEEITEKVLLFAEKYRKRNIENIQKMMEGFDPDKPIQFAGLPSRNGSLREELLYDPEAQELSDFTKRLVEQFRYDINEEAYGYEIGTDRPGFMLIDTSEARLHFQNKLEELGVIDFVSKLYGQKIDEILTNAVDYDDETLEEKLRYVKYPSDWLGSGHKAKIHMHPVIAENDPRGAESGHHYVGEVIKNIIEQQREEKARLEKVASLEKFFDSALEQIDQSIQSDLISSVYGQSNLVEISANRDHIENLMKQSEFLKSDFKRNIEIASSLGVDEDRLKGFSEAFYNRRKTQVETFKKALAELDIIRRKTNIEYCTDSIADIEDYRDLTFLFREMKKMVETAASPDSLKSRFDTLKGTLSKRLDTIVGGQMGHIVRTMIKEAQVGNLHGARTYDRVSAEFYRMQENDFMEMLREVNPELYGTISDKLEENFKEEFAVSAKESMDILRDSIDFPEAANLFRIDAHMESAIQCIEHSGLSEEDMKEMREKIIEIGNRASMRYQQSELKRALGVSAPSQNNGAAGLSS